MRRRLSVTRGLAALVGAGVLAAVPAMSGGAAAAPQSPGQGQGQGQGQGHSKHDGRGLGKQDRELLAKARAKGERTVTLLLVSAPGRGNQVAASVRAVGGKVKYRKDKIQYLRVEVPTGSVEKVAGLNDVTAVDLDAVIPLGDPTPGPAGQIDPLPQPAPGASTPNANPYMPVQDTMTAKFVKSHTKWDGRGVTVGIVDSGVDLHNPALQTTSTGERKIVDWVTRTDPGFTNGVNNDNDPTWLLTSAVSGGTFTAAGTTWTSQVGSSLRFGILDESDPRLGGEVGNDVNRDGNPAGADRRFGVLWDKGTDRVWVDTNQNQSFTDETPMQKYLVNHDVQYFGTDNAGTPIREAMPFVVETSPADNSVNIGIVSANHGSHVSGIVAANNLFGGQADGAAPGAKLVSVRACLFTAGCTNHALLEGMIYAADDANVDVINMSIGGLPALNDGNNARAILYNNLIDEFGVQIFLSAGNSGAGLNTIGDPAVATKAVAVGSYISKATWLSNYGSVVSANDNLHPFSSRGPREDGGFKPQVVAPGSAVSTVPDWQPGQPVGGTYTLPPGLAMLNGTSMAAPQTAGTAAVLVSAMKATKRSVTPAQLRTALLSTARFVPGYGAYEQGNGLIDAVKAWELLQLQPATSDITSSVAVNTILSGFLETPGRGVGIFDREGVSAGDSYTRTYTFTRTSGPAAPILYNLSWVGNDGTFSAPATVSLAKDEAVQVPVQVNVGSVGIHSAVLGLDDPLSPGTEYQTMNTVVAAYSFTAAGSYSQSVSGTIGRNTSKSFFFRVPVGTPAFKVDLTAGGTASGAGQVRFLRFHPYGLGVESNSTPNCYNPSVGGCDAGSPTSRTVSNPQAGVWEVVVEARRTSDTLNAPFSLTASVLGATVSPNPDTIASATLGVPVARSYSITNAFGPFTGRAVGTSLGSAKLAAPTIADAAQQQFQVNVAPGSTSLRATIGGTSDPQADLDLFLYNCTTGSCVLTAQSADGDSEESVTVANPAAGVWVALVDGFAVPAGTTTFNYVDVFANPAFGSVSVTDANALRPAGSSWTVPATVTANAAPANGRVLLGGVEVRTDADVLVGSGQVIVQSVS